MAVLTKKRWPEFNGWDEKAIAIETLADACGAYAYCSQKYQYLNIELHIRDSNRRHFLALQELADLIELATDQEMDASV